MIADRMTVARQSAWTMNHVPPDMKQVEVWDGAGVILAYRDQDYWRDAVTGIRLNNSNEITHWRDVWTSGI